VTVPQHYSLRTSDFSFDLPRTLIAQEPVPVREDSRILVYHRKSGLVEHARFRDIGAFLGVASLLVLNDTKVIPARLIGKKKATGGKVEVFLLRALNDREWECLLKPSGRVREGEVVIFEGSRMVARVGKRASSSTRSVGFEGAEDVSAEVDSIGYMPLPPYIKRTPDASCFTHIDRERYQTVYAARPGAVAAPTAGLHFSRDLLAKLRKNGIEAVSLTLNVGLGTFQPVKEEYVANHRIHSEYFEIGESSAERINRARRDGMKIVIVGTTTARALETVADEGGDVRSHSGWTELFICPPYRFKVVDNLLTNFHLPRSSLLMLVAALVGREKILDLYALAVREGYRFYSYGDAMLLLNDK